MGMLGCNHTLHCEMHPRPTHGNRHSEKPTNLGATTHCTARCTQGQHMEIGTLRSPQTTGWPGRDHTLHCKMHPRPTHGNLHSALSALSAPNASSALALNRSQRYCSAKQVLDHSSASKMIEAPGLYRVIGCQVKVSIRLTLNVLLFGGDEPARRLHLHHELGCPQLPKRVDVLHGNGLTHPYVEVARTSPRLLNGAGGFWRALRAFTTADCSASTASMGTAVGFSASTASMAGLLWASQPP